MTNKKIGIYLSEEEYTLLKQNVKGSGKTLSNYCKEKIFDAKSNSNLDLYILREIENLLYVILSQSSIDEKLINEDKINIVNSLSTYIGNLKAKNNKQRSIKKEHNQLFSVVNKVAIDKLVSQVNSTTKTKEKLILMANYITSIRKVL